MEKKLYVLQQMASDSENRLMGSERTVALNERSHGSGLACLKKVGKRTPPGSLFGMEVGVGSYWIRRAGLAARVIDPCFEKERFWFSFLVVGQVGRRRVGCLTHQKRLERLGKENPCVS